MVKTTAFKTTLENKTQLYYKKFKYKARFYETNLCFANDVTNIHEFYDLVREEKKRGNRHWTRYVEANNEPKIKKIIAFRVNIIISPSSLMTKRLSKNY